MTCAKGRMMPKDVKATTKYYHSPGRTAKALYLWLGWVFAY